MHFFEAASGQIFEVEHHLGKGRMQDFQAKGNPKLLWKPKTRSSSARAKDIAQQE